MKIINLIILISTLFTFAASARIGETEDELVKRYGKAFVDGRVLKH